MSPSSQKIEVISLLDVPASYTWTHCVALTKLYRSHIKLTRDQLIDLQRCYHREQEDKTKSTGIGLQGTDSEATHAGFHPEPGAKVYYHSQPRVGIVQMGDLRAVMVKRKLAQEAREQEELIRRKEAEERQLAGRRAAEKLEKQHQRKQEELRKQAQLAFERKYIELGLQIQAHDLEIRRQFELNLLVQQQARQQEQQRQYQAWLVSSQHQQLQVHQQPTFDARQQRRNQQLHYAQNTPNRTQQSVQRHTQPAQKPHHNNWPRPNTPSLPKSHPLPARPRASQLPPTPSLSHATIPVRTLPRTAGW